MRRCLALALLLWFWASPAHAAYTCDVSASGNASAGDLTTATTSAFNSTGKDLIVFMIAIDSRTSVSEISPTITDNQGNTYTEVLTGTPSGFTKLRMFYTRPVTVSATHTVTYDNGRNNFPSVGALACSGSPDSPIDLFTSAAKDTGTTITSNVTPSNDNALIVTAIAQLSTGTMSISGAGFSTAVTVGFFSGRNYGIGFSYQIQTTAQAAGPTWTTPNNDTAMVIVSFKSSGAAVPCTGVP